jgi:hypothetical protein
MGWMGQDKNFSLATITKILFMDSFLLDKKLPQDTET